MKNLKNMYWKVISVYRPVFLKPDVATHLCVTEILRKCPQKIKLQLMNLWITTWKLCFYSKVHKLQFKFFCNTQKNFGNTQMCWDIWFKKPLY